MTDKEKALAGKGGEGQEALVRPRDRVGFTILGDSGGKGTRRV